MDWGKSHVSDPLSNYFTVVEGDVLVYHKEATFRYDRNCGPQFKTWMALARAECKALVEDFNECLPEYLIWAREQEVPVVVQSEVQEDVYQHRTKRAVAKGESLYSGTNGPLDHTFYTAGKSVVYKDARPIRN